MTTYKQMKHALLRNSTIEMYKPTARLIQMVTILACHGIVSIVSNGIDWRVTLLRKPVVTAADAPPLAVVEKPLLARVRLADKIRYHDGKRIVSEQWSGTAYPVTGVQHGFVILDTDYGAIGRKPENVLIPGYTQAETVNHLAIRFASVQKAAA